MSHVRKQIRDAVATALNGLPITGTNVFPARLYPLENSKLPGICLYTNDEETDGEQGKFDTFDNRRLTLSIEAHCKLVAGLDDQLDDIAEDVEDVMLAQGYDIGGLAKTIDLATTRYGKTASGDQPAGIVVMDFIITYFINRGASGTAL
jgi:hypothetical protein